jgi:hypothetical protein
MCDGLGVGVSDGISVGVGVGVSVGVGVGGALIVVSGVGFGSTVGEMMPIVMVSVRNAATLQMIAIPICFFAVCLTDRQMNITKNTINAITLIVQSEITKLSIE